MSSFIVEDKTINRIVSFCFWENDSILKYNIERELKEVGINLHNVLSDEETDKILKCFGEDLLKLNIFAFYERYKNSKEIEKEIKKEIEKSIKNYVYEDLPLKDRNRLQVLKSIECFLYQCSEGDIPETPLFKVLEKITNHLKNYIINAMPEYNLAIWG